MDGFAVDRRRDSDYTVPVMNVFVLNTGRCGSTTFIEACRHITNYTCGHETRAGRLGAERFAYPPNHIEADNRLSWFLGRCDRAYGDRAFYVHLTRDGRAVARSFARRFSGGIIRSYRRGMLMRLPRRCDPEAIAADYCETVTRNIELFLKDKTHKIGVALETAEADFPRFWRAIGAEGDLDAALAEFRVPYNASKQRLFSPRALVQRLARLVGR